MVTEMVMVVMIKERFDDCDDMYMDAMLQSNLLCST